MISVQCVVGYEVYVGMAKERRQHLIYAIMEFVINCSYEVESVRGRTEEGQLAGAGRIGIAGMGCFGIE